MGVGLYGHQLMDDLGQQMDRRKAVEFLILDFVAAAGSKADRARGRD
jgi:hypothetical protein